MEEPGSMVVEQKTRGKMERMNNAYRNVGGTGWFWHFLA
jgi:hypothetical protein